jgi:hypothetical protein
MAGCVEMFCGVFVFRAVTTADMAAREAHPQVYPRVADLHALLANRDVFRMDIFYLADVGARISYDYLGGIFHFIFFCSVQALI